MEILKRHFPACGNEYISACLDDKEEIEEDMHSKYYHPGMPVIFVLSPKEAKSITKYLTILI